MKKNNFFYPLLDLLVFLFLGIIFFNPVLFYKKENNPYHPTPEEWKEIGRKTMIEEGIL